MTQNWVGFIVRVVETRVEILKNQLEKNGVGSELVRVFPQTLIEPMEFSIFSPVPINRMHAEFSFFIKN